MSTELAVLVPVLGRPHRVAPLLDAFEATTPGACVLFLADPHDRPELEAIERELNRDAIRVEVDTQGGNYAQKVNRAVTLTDEPLVFAAADDLVPQDGWLAAAKATLEGDVQVVGVNDLIERRRDHATHFLITRSYAELPTIDGKPGPFFEGYSHWYCDDELLATARHRDAYAYAQDSVVEHLHPIASRAEDDATYRKGRERMREDRKVFTGRRRLWA